ncbi:MAG: FAD-dependent oxidoreductase [Devosiaceae bacterium]|nr:FAD-dependent oxidoreductase [Devosiaceae bacterium]
MDRRKTLGVLGGAMLSGFVASQPAKAGVAQLRGYIRTNWSRDPLTYGSYSYVPKGVQLRDRKVLETPVAARVFFAGEAVFSKYNSTVHAAYGSGQHTASMVKKTGAKTVAIIGAGMSGLSAAHHLGSVGLEVSVFEARNRIGGRIWTDKSLGEPLDLGASWIHGVRGNPLTKLANEAGLERIATDETYVIRGGDGRRIHDDAYPDWLEDVVTIQQNSGADVDQLNMAVYNNEEGYSGAEVVFPNGYAGILESLKGGYVLQLSTLVRGVSYTDKNITLKFVNQADKIFDAVIVTLPLGALKRETIQFSPVLPAQKRKAIQRLGMGVLDKLYLKFDRPFWDMDKTWIITPENNLPQGQFNQWLNMYSIVGAPVLLGFNGGSAALDLAGLSDKELVKRGMQCLKMAYPN